MEDKKEWEKEGQEEEEQQDGNDERSKQQQHMEAVSRQQKKGKTGEGQEGLVRIKRGRGRVVDCVHKDLIDAATATTTPTLAMQQSLLKR